MTKYYVSVFVNNRWKFINCYFASSPEEAINQAKKSQPLYSNLEWKYEID